MKENSEYKSLILRMKIDLVSHPVCAERSVSIYIYIYIYICIPPTPVGLNSLAKEVNVLPLAKHKALRMNRARGSR